MKRKPIFLRLTAGALAAALLASCAQSAETAPAVTVVKDQPLGADCAWINSSVDGAIGADTATDVNTDFYTAINRDWLLQPLPAGQDEANAYTELDAQFTANYKQLLQMSADDLSGLDTALMSSDTLAHIQQLVHKMLDLGGDTASRNSLGAEPLRPFLTSIENISTMDELTAYFGNANGQNLFNIQLTPFSLQEPIGESSTGFYTVLIEPAAALGLLNHEPSPGLAGLFDRYRRDNASLVKYELKQLGYSGSDINKILKACYRFEQKLARCLPTSEQLNSGSYYTYGDRSKSYSRAGLDALTGDYPLGVILDALGMGHSSSYTAPAVTQLREVGLLYNADNLNDIKAYLEVQTILQAASLLDETSAAKAAKAHSPGTSDADDEDGTAPVDAELAALAAPYDAYVTPYLGDALQQMYLAHFCTATQKEQLRALTEQVAGGVGTMLYLAPWADEDTYNKAMEKLDAVDFRVLYPDAMTDYSSLDLSECSNLLEAAAVLNRFNRAQDAARIDQSAQGAWDITQAEALAPSVQYERTTNTLTVTAGTLATDTLFSGGKSVSENLGGMGLLIAHELMHGFDAAGAGYNASGKAAGWWSGEEQAAFAERCQKLNDYLATLPMTDADGNTVTPDTEEIIADMGGMKALLSLAWDIPDFDYDAFFRSCAAAMRAHRTPEAEAQTIADGQPCEALRLDLTLVQFVDFPNTYFPQEGDGMYQTEAQQCLMW